MAALAVGVEVEAVLVAAGEQEVEELEVAAERALAAVSTPAARE